VEADSIKAAAIMFETHIVEDTLLGPFNQGTEKIGGIVVHLAAGTLIAVMVGYCVGCKAFCNAAIGSMLVAHQMSLSTIPGVHLLRQLSDLIALN
jgi:hypothetical protein